MWNKKISEAVNFAINCHLNQKRKGSDLPYFKHPLSAGIILARAGVSDELIMAGFLHDTLEDCDVEKSDLEKRFGKKVADLVESVSEKDKSLPWKRRKADALKKLKEANEEVLLLKAADTLANLVDLQSSLDEKGEDAFSIFNAEKNEKIKQTRKVVKALSDNLKSDSIISNIKEVFEKIEKYED